MVETKVSAIRVLVIIELPDAAWKLILEALTVEISPRVLIPRVLPIMVLPDAMRKLIEEVLTEEI